MQAVVSLGTGLLARSASNAGLGPAAEHSRVDAKLELLARLPVFAGCSRKELVRLGRITDLAHWEAGESLLVEGGRCEHWVVIARGCALVLRDDRPLCALGPGDWCGDGAIARHSPSDVTVVAMTPITVVVMSHQHFLALPGRFPAVATFLVRALCARSSAFERT